MSSAFEHGVSYLPSTVFDSDKALTFDRLDDFNIVYIRVQCIGIAGHVRFRVFPVQYFRKLMRSPRPGVGVPLTVLGIALDLLAPGFPPTREYLYVPDLSTLKICPYSQQEAVVMGWFQEKTPHLSARGELTVDVALCPRTLLQRIVQQAADLDIQFLIGFECEFILLKSTRPIELLTRHRGMIIPESLVDKVVREIADSVQASAIELQGYYPEYAPSQYEIVTGPLPPLEAVDALIHTKQIIYNTALKHGVQATFAPKVFEDMSDGLSPIESSFLSSLLANLPALTALMLPIPQSYDRVVDGIMSGGTYVNWGTENREAPVRLTNATSPSSRNLEVRCMDGISNPYFALAGILGVGLAGIRDQVPLDIKDCSGEQTAAQMTEEARRELGITKRLPLTWEEARQHLRENDFLRYGVLGAKVAENYLAVNQTFADALGADDSLSLLVENF